MEVTENDVGMGVGTSNSDSDKPSKPDKIRQCALCGQSRVIKSPWDALWRMPTLNEWIILFMLIMMLVVSWAYKRDTAICRDFVANIADVCKDINFNVSSVGSVYVGPSINWSAENSSYYTENRSVTEDLG